MAGKKVNAFTLIELLVVISIIALLLAILIPSLAKVKDMGRMVHCMSNHKNLVTAWNIYSTDNIGELADGHTRGGGDLEDDELHWVEPPLDLTNPNDSQYAGGNSSTPTELEHELNGIRSGTLYSYIENVEVYHCFSDRRYDRSSTYYQPSAYRTYSITANMNGENRGNNAARKIFASKENQITRPSDRFVFLDDFDARSYNVGSWMFNYDTSNSGGHRLSDPISVWHYKKVNFSFADGHVKSYVWKDKRTYRYSRWRAFGEGDQSSAGTSADNEDLRYLAEGYRAR